MATPTDETAFRTAQVEALLATALEAADKATGEFLDPEDQAILTAIGDMGPEDIQGDEVAEETDEETPPIPAALPAPAPAGDTGGQR